MKMKYNKHSCIPMKHSDLVVLCYVGSVVVCESIKEHRCGEGRCVPTEWLCDGDYDCLDKSDELNCCETLQTTHTHIADLNYTPLKVF